ncbi:MAG: single-stranded-DNA-specific exonuclease RecJ [Hyphomonadaceae bacterium]|nr:single-stranded-DNA-specific exonuclease RecJ [Hyphomonadaceae bacterium]
MAAQSLPEERLFGVETSLTGRFWALQNPDPLRVRQLAAHLGQDDLLARLLALRDVGANEVESFLSPTLRSEFPDPSSFADMDKAAGLVLDALLDGRNVTVFADYDVDGGTSSAILARYFRAWGRDLGLYVPDRLAEGYGPSPEAFRHLKATGADLVITVDCGAAALSALEEANAIDLPIVVIDHHLMQGAIPEAAALVNPNRPDDASGCGHLAAAGVVFVFVAALNRLARQRKITPPGGELPNPIEWLDLAALGTLCDMAPLRGVNRAFVRQGLKILQRGENTGIRALADVAGLGEVSSVYHATFMLGPRLNAGGRVGDPWLAAKLLASDDREEAIGLAERLHALNDERKAIEQDILEAATAHAQRQLEANPQRGVLIAGGEGWHPGVIGIVAGRLKDRFHLPSIVIGWGQGLGPVAKGSARSVTGVNIGDAIAAAAREGVILSGGGHAMAGGLSCQPDQIEALDSWMCAHMHQFAEERAAAKGLSIDTLIAPGAATTDLVETVAKLGPFGAGATEPVFGVRDVRCMGARRIGANHIKFTAEDETGKLDCVAWRMADEPLGEAAIAGARLHLVGRLKINTWNGRSSVQFEVMDGAEVR